MNRLILRFITASAWVCGFFCPIAKLTAQTRAQDLVGTWALVSITLERDGKKTDFYGLDPQGQATYGANGRLSVIITRSDLPQFVSKNRELGTPEENKAVVQGSIAYFGTYSVNETAKTITIHIESCTFPNWNGIDRKVSFNISGNELHIASPTSSTGTGSNQQVWKRAE
ncbi:MAG: lipocalin-like domain-containing protein [Verrucomicrobia bacterium]|nr:lipocalin-like domain-containing protein [Verrucomicrobiota bacterium]